MGSGKGILFAGQPGQLQHDAVSYPAAQENLQLFALQEGKAGVPGDGLKSGAFVRKGKGEAKSQDDGADGGNAALPDSLGKIEARRQHRHFRPEGYLAYTFAAPLQLIGVFVPGAFGKNSHALAGLQPFQAGLADCLAVGFLLVFVQDGKSGVFSVGVDGVDPF